MDGFMFYKVFFLLLPLTVLLTGCICPPCSTRSLPPERPMPVEPDFRSDLPPSPRTAVPVPRPEDGRPLYHTVEAGENLYRIGLRYGLRPEEIMAFNGLPDTRISVGQVLQLFPGERAAAPTPRFAPAPATSTPRAPAPGPSAPSVRAPASPSVSGVSRVSADQLALLRSVEGINWRWPTAGNVVGTFRADDVSRQGLAIAGDRGQQVLAAADGVVTYQGEALASYGKLLIIKHNDQFLTAYAHNDSFLVKEGDRVRAGQPIATMGNTGAERVQLGFEVRKGGNPVDPLRYLPEL
jgi:lipoprotein NlpD